MQKIVDALTTLPDEELIQEVEILTARERQATAHLVASLIEMESRELYRGLGFSSMFAYCTQRLRLSEDEACNRLEIARTARRFPVLLERIADRSLTPTAVRLLAPLLTEENLGAVVAAATHKSKREVEILIARLRPVPDVPSTIRKLPAPRTATSVRPSSAGLLATDAPNDADNTGTTTAPASDQRRPAAPVAPRSIMSPLAPERYKLQFTIGPDTHDKLRRIQDLLARSVPDGDPAVIFDCALTVLLAQLEKQKLAKTDRPRPGRDANPAGRHIPAAVKRAVWARDEGRCAFVGASGRCTATRYLEFHHVIPFADGGPTVASNLQLRCRTHNAYEAELRFGPLCVREREVPYWPFRNGFMNGAAFASVHGERDG